MLAHEDRSEVPGGELSLDHIGRRNAWDVDIGKAHVSIVTGASHWRVMLFKRKDRWKKDAIIRLITPHVFVTAFEAYGWAKAWVKHRSVRHHLWRDDWGTMPTWPKKRNT